MAENLSEADVDAKNLAQIRRIDVCAESILDKATHTALYNFNPGAKAWEKTEVNGAMFIYKRVDHPVYSLMIANRQSPEDLIEPINHKIRMKVENQYLFFCKEDGSIRGLWFFEEEDCKRIHKLLEKIVNQLRTENRISPPKSSVTNSSVSTKDTMENGGGFNINMLMGGDNSVPTTSTSSSKTLMTPIAIKAAPPSPKQPSAIMLPVSQPPPAASPLSNAMPSCLQKLMPEQFPPTIGLATGSALGGPALTAADLERDLLRKVMRLGGSGGGGDLALPPSASAASLNALSTQSVHGSDGDVNELESMTGGLSLRAHRGTRATLGGDTDRVPSVSPPSCSSPPGLDKSQFLAGIVHLLQTDDEFLTKVHQAYVDALNRRLGL